jgi:hypothetical protein
MGYRRFIHERVDIDIYFCWHEHDLCAAAFRRTFLRIQPGQDGGNDFLPPQNQFPLYIQLDLLYGLFIPRPLSLSFVYLVPLVGISIGTAVSFTALETSVILKKPLKHGESIVFFGGREGFTGEEIEEVRQSG